MKVLMVCHAGIGIGLGHFSRSLVIANALRSRFKADVRWLIQGNSLDRDDLKAFRHEFVPLNYDLARQITAQGPIDLILLDLQSLHVPKELSSALGVLRAAGTKVVAIDCLLTYRSELDLIFIPSFHFKQTEDVKKGAPIVFGWDCLLLDPKLSRSTWTHGPNVLALSGGSDATKLGMTWPVLLDQSLPADAELHWVTGPFARKPRWPTKSRITMFEHVAPAGLGPLMQQANYAVTVFGVSFFELLYFGVPTVVFSPYGLKDSEEIRAIEASGVALVADDERKATERLIELMGNVKLAQQMSQRAHAKLSTSGTKRFCEEISGLIAYEGKNFKDRVIYHET